MSSKTQALESSLFEDYVVGFEFGIIAWHADTREAEDDIAVFVEQSAQTNPAIGTGFKDALDFGYALKLAAQVVG